MASEDRIDTVINSVVVAILGVILICSLMIPVITDQIGLLSDANNAKYGILLSTVVILTIVGLIISIIKGMTSSGAR